MRGPPGDVIRSGHRTALDWELPLELGPLDLARTE